MTVINLASPYAMKNATLTFGEDDYTAAVSQAELQPSTNTSTWKGVGGNTITGTDNASWVLALGLAQDDDPAGLMRYLFDNEGAEVPVTLVPVADGTSWAATVIVSPTNIGGTAGSDLAQSTVSLAVVGKPVPTDAA